MFQQFDPFLQHWLSGPTAFSLSVHASALALRYTSLFVSVRLMYIVSMFTIFQSPFNWKVSNFDVASVGCGAWEPYKNLETQADWKTCSFHFFGRSLVSKNNWHGLEDYSTCQLVSQYPYLSMSFCPRFAKACHLQSDLVVCVECNVCTFVIAQFHILDLLRFFLNQFQVCFLQF